MNNAFKKTVLAMTAVGVVMGPIMPSIAMANEHGYQSNGVANYLDADAQEIGHNGGKNRTEKGSPYGWKAGGTFFGMLIDASDGHWGNNVLDASVNQLYIPSSVHYYAGNAKFYKAKINTLVAEANGFNTSVEMLAWVTDNLSVDYKVSLLNAVVGIEASEVEAVVAKAVASGTTNAAKVVTPLTFEEKKAIDDAARERSDEERRQTQRDSLEDEVPPAPMDPAPVAPSGTTVASDFGGNLGLSAATTVEALDRAAMSLVGLMADATLTGDQVVKAGNILSALVDEETNLGPVVSGTVGDFVDSIVAAGLEHTLAGGISMTEAGGIYGAAVAAGVAAGLSEGDARDAAKQALEDSNNEALIEFAATLS